MKICWRKGTQGGIRWGSSSRPSIQSSVPNRRLTVGRHGHQRLPLSCHPLYTGSLFFASDARGHDPSYSNAKESSSRTQKQSSHTTVPFDSTSDVSTTHDRSSSSEESVVVDLGDATRTDGILKYGLPERQSEFIRKRRNYVVCYSGVQRIPLWTAECLTPHCLSGNYRS